jgi:hypothetical protein
MNISVCVTQEEKVDATVSFFVSRRVKAGLHLMAILARI